MPANNKIDDRKYVFLTKTFEPKYYQYMDYIPQIRSTIFWILKHLKQHCEAFIATPDFTKQGIIHYHVLLLPINYGHLLLLRKHLKRQGFVDTPEAKSYSYVEKYCLNKYETLLILYKDYYKKKLPSSFTSDPGFFMFNQYTTNKTLKYKYPIRSIKLFSV